MIEAILLDVDGTLTNGRKEITPKTEAALRAAEAAGIRLVLASGRTDNGLSRFGRQLGMYEHDGVFVCYNGAKAVDCQTGEILFSQAMSVDAARRVLEHMKRFDVWPIMDHGCYMYVNDVFAGMVTNPDGTRRNIIEYESRSNSYLLCEERDLAAFVDWEPKKILVAAAAGIKSDTLDRIGRTRSSSPASLPTSRSIGKRWQSPLRASSAPCSRRPTTTSSLPRASTSRRRSARASLLSASLPKT